MQCKNIETAFDTALQTESFYGTLEQLQSESESFRTFHRKSERRRVARDIFLVFEEQPSSRRARGSKQKRIRTKSKFGHLKVDTQNKTNILLRDIKKEYHQSGIRPKKPTKVIIDKSVASTNQSTARVNPIFLWVKEENTRIVEVRCEDYDKRNRIRLTKTTNGWQATPRTDPSSSKTVKYLQKPLIKVKREIFENETHDEELNQATSNLLPETCLISGSTNIQVMRSSKSKRKERRDDNIMKRKKLKKKLYIKRDDASVTVSQSHQEIVPQSEIECDLALHEFVSENLNTEERPFLSTSNMQLCPKTGIFMQSEEDNIQDSDEIMETIPICIMECDMEGNKTDLALSNVENINIEEKNLKDLLDDADLLHCGDNINSGSELIDSLVKRSCENDLVEETNSVKDFMLNKLPVSNENSLLHNGVALPQIMNSVSDPPKCLSFNEAGEIEGLNEDLFDSFADKESMEKRDSISQKPCFLDKSTTQFGKNDFQNMLIDETVKDLSYKKAELFGASTDTESFSQCAVTSSSDVLKPAGESEISGIDISNDSMKSLIMDQLGKYNSVPNSTVKCQAEPIDLGKHKQLEVSQCSTYDQTTSCAESVVFTEANSNEPSQKRVCNNEQNADETTLNISVRDDPDPLTQLKLLIKNSQWKVPDPILVPKERLGAVLASPAREIPLLITTRPELRLPEAFAYPEIIQNPNILVISMAQLEAILRNEVDCKNKTQIFSNCKSDNKPPTDVLNKSIRTSPEDINIKCPHVDSSLLSDINVTALAVLNQMIWMPYFNHISQEILKSIKSSGDLQNKYEGLISIYKHHLSVEQLDDILKNYLKNQNTSKQNSVDLSNQLQSSVYPAILGRFKNSFECALLQNVIQQQMQYLLANNTMSKEAPKNEKNKQIFTQNGNTSNTLPLCNSNIETKQCQSIELSRPKSTTSSSASTHRSVKPRLTCKALSNLLEPEIASAEYNRKSQDAQHILINRKLTNGNPSMHSKGKNCVDSSDNFNFTSLTSRGFHSDYSTPSQLKTADPESPFLWHPLFGSNTKPGYSSPWQWNSVAAPNP